MKFKELFYKMNEEKLNNTEDGYVTLICSKSRLDDIVTTIAKHTPIKDYIWNVLLEKDFKNDSIKLKDLIGRRVIFCVNDFDAKYNCSDILRVLDLPEYIEVELV